MDTILVEPSSDGRLSIRLPYSPERVAKIKSIAGRSWDGRNKRWLIPCQADTVERLRALFPDEALELSAALENKAAPAAPLIERLRRAVRARHCSPSTEKAYAGWVERFLSRHGGALTPIEKPESGGAITSTNPSSRERLRRRACAPQSPSPPAAMP